jgi:hypothetical protein
MKTYEGVSISFRTGCLERELQMVQTYNHHVQLYRYFVSHSSEFCRHNPLCCVVLISLWLSPETFGYTLVWGTIPALTSALDGGGWSASCPGRFTQGTTGTGDQWKEDCVGPKAGLDAVAKRIKIPVLSLPGIETPPSSSQGSISVEH